jgi:nucleoside-specific outer membrane channel protein Tsx
MVMILPGMDAQRFFVGLGQVLATGWPDQNALNVYGKQWGVESFGPPLSKGLR